MRRPTSRLIIFSHLAFVFVLLIYAATFVDIFLEEKTLVVICRGVIRTFVMALCIIFVLSGIFKGILNIASYTFLGLASIICIHLWISFYTGESFFAIGNRLYWLFVYPGCFVFLRIVALRATTTHEYELAYQKLAFFRNVILFFSIVFLMLVLLRSYLYIATGLWFGKMSHITPETTIYQTTYTIFYLSATLLLCFSNCKQSNTFTKTLIIILLGLSTFIIFYYFKRGPAICLIVFFVSYLTCSMLNKKNFFRYSFLGVLLLCFIFLLVTIPYINERIITRMEDLGGSGRNHFYFALLEEFNTFSGLDFLIGKGINYSFYIMLEVIGIFTHSHMVWLELALNFGIIGVLVFVFWNANFVFNATISILKRNSLTPLYPSMYSFLIVSSFFTNYLFDSSFLFILLTIALLDSSKNIIRL